MTENECENIQISAMAIRDGQVPPVPADQVEKHLAHCSACREEIAQDQALAAILDNCHRQSSVDDLWPQVATLLKENRSADHPNPSLVVITLLVIASLATRVFSPSLNIELSLFIGAALTLLAAATFWHIGINPFKINPHLQMKGA